MSRGRAYTFTVNNYTEAEYDSVINLDCVYLVVGKEVAATGTPHLQGYVYYKTVKSMSQVSKDIPRAHLEQAKGSAVQNREYCSKGGSFYEKGVCPMDSKKKGQVESERWELALKAYQEDRRDDIPKDILIRNLGGLKNAAAYLGKRKLEDTEEKHLWYWGRTRTGKSRKARTENPGAYLKMCNKWWCDYANEDVVIIEDFDKKHDGMAYYLKIWGDRFPFPAEVKGSKIDIRPRLVIVTSNYHPEQIWQDQSDIQPIMERFKCVCFNPEENRVEGFNPLN